MSDYEYLIRFCERFKVKYQEFTNSPEQRKFITEKALSCGTIKSVSLYHPINKYGMADFNFNDKGKCVGYNDSHEGSFFSLLKK